MPRKAKTTKAKNGKASADGNGINLGIEAVLCDPANKLCEPFDGVEIKKVASKQLFLKNDSNTFEVVTNVGAF